jgi:predicted nucleotidyltransferase
VAVRPQVPDSRIREFCERWKIVEFALFGSIVRDDFNDDSDVDVLVAFLPGAGWSLYDFMDMQDELARLFGRKVDLVDKDGLRNPFRRKAILDEARVLYAA